MELKINEQKDNKLLSRIEIKGSLSFQGATPSNDKVKEAIAKQMNKDAKLVIVKNIYTKFGDQSADVSAFVYENEEKLKQIEPSKKEKKGDKKEEAPAEEAPKQEAAPKEEEKETSKEEVQKEEPKE